MIKVKFLGILANKLGTQEMELEVETFGEAIRAIEINSGNKFSEQLQELLDNKIVYQVSFDSKQLTRSNIYDNIGSKIWNNIIFYPQEAQQTGMTVMVVMSIISIALQLVSMLLMKQPKLDLGSANTSSTRRRENYLFDGKAKPVVQGNPVPVGYGRMLVQPILINSYHNLPEAQTVSLRQGRFFYSFRSPGQWDNQIADMNPYILNELNEVGIQIDSIFNKGVINVNIDGIDYNYVIKNQDKIYNIGIYSANLSTPDQYIRINDLSSYWTWRLDYSQSDCVGRDNDWGFGDRRRFATFFPGNYITNTSENLMVDYGQMLPMNYDLATYNSNGTQQRWYCSRPNIYGGLLVFANYVRNDGSLKIVPANFQIVFQIKIKIKRWTTQQWDGGGSDGYITEEWEDLKNVDFSIQLDDYAKDCIKFNKQFQIKILDKIKKEFSNQLLNVSSNQYSGGLYGNGGGVVYIEPKKIVQNIYGETVDTSNQPQFNIEFSTKILMQEKLGSYYGATLDMEKENFQLARETTIQIERDCAYLLKRKYNSIYQQVDNVNGKKWGEGEAFENINPKCVDYTIGIWNPKGIYRPDFLQQFGGIHNIYITQDLIGKEFEYKDGEVGATNFYRQNLDLRNGMFGTVPIGRSFLFNF